MSPDVGWCVACTLGEICEEHVGEKRGRRPSLPKSRRPEVCECGRRVHAGFYCPTCYQRRREGREDPIRPYGVRECSACGAKHYARGLCRRHYRSARARSQ
jgi:hypothetical protein